MEKVDRGLWYYEITGEHEKEAARDLEARYEQLDRIAARTPYDLDYDIESGGWIAEIETKYNVHIKVRP
jgi:hypothetical protein